MSSEFFKDQFKKGLYDYELNVFRESLQDLVITPGRIIRDFLDLAQEIEGRPYLHQGIINPDAELTAKAVMTAANEASGHPQSSSDRRTEPRDGTKPRELRAFYLSKAPGEYHATTLKNEIKKSGIRGANTTCFRVMQKLISEGYYTKVGGRSGTVYTRTRKSIQ